MKKKVSIIIPAYNSEKYLLDALDSVYMQTYTNFEVIVVNDGSTDNTLSILERYKKNVSNLNVINIKNHGQGYARNLAVKSAKGDYILFFDSDDILNPLLLETAVKQIEKDKSDFVFFDWTRFNDRTKKEMKSREKPFINEKILTNKNCIEMLSLRPYYTVVCLYDKDFLLKNNLKYGENYYYEDIIFWLKVVDSAKKISILKDSLYRVRYNDRSVTSTNYNSEKHYKSFINMLNDSNKYLRNKKKRNYNEFYNYIVNRFFIYYSERTYEIYKKDFKKDFFGCMSDAIIKTDEKNCSDDLKKIISFVSENNREDKLEEYVQKIQMAKKNKSKISKLINSCKKRTNENCSNYFLNNKKDNIIVFFSEYNNLLKNIYYIKKLTYKSNYYLLMDNNTIEKNLSFLNYAKDKAIIIPYDSKFQRTIIDIFYNKINTNKKKYYIKKSFKQMFSNANINKIVLDDAKYKNQFLFLCKNIEIVKFNDIGRIIEK